MTAPVAPGSSDFAGWDLHSLESNRLTTAHGEKRHWSAQLGKAITEEAKFSHKVVLSDHLYLEVL